MYSTKKMDSNSIYSKLATVPAPIKTWLGSDDIINDIDKMDSKFMIPKGSSDVIVKLIQMIQVKDMDPGYFSGELASTLKLDKNKATHITAEIKKTIFSPISKDLEEYGINISELDKFQMPVVKDLQTDGPTIISDINVSAPISVATATSQTLTTSHSLKGAAIPNSNSVPPAPKPNRLSDVGWSRSRTADPVVKLDITQPPKAVAGVANASASTPTPQRPPTTTPQPVVPTGANHALGEFERLNAMKKPSAGPAAAPIAPPAPSSPSEPAPFMLHEDTSFKAQIKNNDFSLPKPGAGSQMQMSAVKPQVPLKPAVLEFGTASNTAPKSPTAPSKVIHYTEFSSSLSSTPTANSGPRTVNQVMPGTQEPPTPTVPMPRPPMPPQPPRPPQALQAQSTTPTQQEKVIVKDFL